MEMKKTKSICRSAILSVLTYDADSGVLTWLPILGQPQRNARFAGRPAGTIHKTSDGKRYIAVSVGRERYLAHRVVWTILHGPIPDGMQIDHINGDGLDNRAANLRLVTESGNQRNTRRSRKNTTGYVGVRRADTKGPSYQAYSSAGGKFRHLGVRPTPAEAYELRRAFERSFGFHPNHGQDRPL